MMAAAGAQVMPDPGFHSAGRGAPMPETLPSLADLPRSQPRLSEYLLQQTPFVGPLLLRGRTPGARSST